MLAAAWPRIAVQIDFGAAGNDGGVMGEAARLSDTVLTFRVTRAEEFARQWRTNARRLQVLASSPSTPASVRDNALAEARTAGEIVAKRADDIVALARERGFSSWEADPVLGPLVVEIRAVENALNYAADALSKG